MGLQFITSCCQRCLLPDMCRILDRPGPLVVLAQLAQRSNIIVDHAIECLKVVRVNRYHDGQRRCERLFVPRAIALRPPVI